MSVPDVFWPFRQDEESHEHHRHPAFPRRLGVTGDVGMKLCVPFDGNEDHFGVTTRKWRICTLRANKWVPLPAQVTDKC